MSNNESVLKTVKQINAIHESDTDFDGIIIPLINSCLSELCQMGIVDESKSFITGETETWDDLLPGSLSKSLAKEYVGLKVQSIFNPPSSGAANEAIERAIDRLEYRLRIDSTGGL